VHIFNCGFGKFYCPNFRHDPPSGFVVERDADLSYISIYFATFFPAVLKMPDFIDFLTNSLFYSKS